MTVHRVGLGTIELVLGDIVDQNVDAIVNAANSQLAGGGGVDGAIHRAAGPQLLRWCQQITPNADGQRCPTGEVRVTAAGNLSARWVIHAVGPIYHVQQQEQASELLRAAHHQALETAAELGCQSIAFSAISTGIYGFPVELAAPLALGVAYQFLLQNRAPQDIRWVLFGEPHWQVFEQALLTIENT
jgi:O-acetyl-ADP-ribose deacetylase (regulator of RNase III)